MSLFIKSNIYHERFNKPEFLIIAIITGYIFELLNMIVYNYDATGSFTFSLSSG